MYSNSNKKQSVSSSLKDLVMLVVLAGLLLIVVVGTYGARKKINEQAAMIEELELQTKTSNTHLTAGISYQMNQIATNTLANAGITTPNTVTYEETDTTLVKAAQETTIEGVIEEPEPVITTDTDSLDTTLMVSSNVLNVRTEPSTDAEVLMKLNIGTKLSVTGLTTVYIDGEESDTKWYEVSTSKGTGYCAAEYLTDEDVKVFLGNYTITHYCDCPICCDIETGITASGAKTTEGVTCAADSFLPFGTKVEIDGNIYTVQDRGSAVKGNHIDIYVKGHSNALKAGTQYNVPVYKVIAF